MKPFQSSPDSEAGRNTQANGGIHADLTFQSSPDSEAGRNAPAESHEAETLIVPILARLGSRAQRMRSC